MNTRRLFPLIASVWVLSLAGGCTTPSNSSSTPAVEPSGEGKASASKRYLTPDGRTVRVGSWTAQNGGKEYKNPNLTRCWVADGFNFVGYDALYILPISTTVSPTEPRSQEMLRTAQSRLLDSLKAKISGMGLFAKVVTQEQEIPAGAKVVRLEQKITEFVRGNGAARFWAGAFGAGQPVLKVEGKLQEGGKDLFTYEARRNGDSASARLDPGWTKEESLQLLDIEDLVTDLTDFMGVASGRYAAKP